MIAQLTERPELSKMLGELFHPSGASISLRAADLYVPSHTLAYAEVVAAARAQGQVALGYRLSDGAVTLNPPKSSTVTLGADDQVIVLSAVGRQ